MLVFENMGKVEYLEKTSQNKDDNQQQPQTTFDAKSRNQTWVTSVGGISAFPTVPSLISEFKEKAHS